MRSQDDMSYEEISQALQLSVSNVKVKIHRARLKLTTLVGRTVLS
jgi:DNA-directed RNA polymerase specialized sigma24 family protein